MIPAPMPASLQYGPDRPGKSLLFPIVLLLLGLLCVYLWFSDPSHGDGDKSRINWPDAPSPSDKKP